MVFLLINEETCSDGFNGLSPGVTAGSRGIGSNPERGPKSLIFPDSVDVF